MKITRYAVRLTDHGLYHTGTKIWIVTGDLSNANDFAFATLFSSDVLAKNAAKRSDKVKSGFFSFEIIPVTCEFDL